MQKTQNNNNDSMTCCLDNPDCKVLAEVRSLRAEVALLKEQVRTDALTGLYNFRFFNELIGLEMERTRRGAQPLSMIMLDIDHFKQFNDCWGHEPGNQALVHVANLIRLAVRKLDFPCRFGGEEFVIVLPNTDLRQAVSVAERLREMIAQTPLQLTPDLSANLTASLGVDQFSASLSETSDVFKQRVDSWLYKAKAQGRNRVAHPPFDTLPAYASVTLDEKNALFNNSDE